MTLDQKVNEVFANLTGPFVRLVFAHFPGWITGLVFAVVVFAVIVGGVKSIARVPEKVVPFMGALYVGGALIILVVNYDKIGWAFGQIFVGAFTVIGAAASLGPIIDFSDAAIFAMAVVNIVALYCLMGVVRQEMQSYGARLKSGEIKKFSN